MGEVALERTEEQHFQPRGPQDNVPEECEMDNECPHPEPVVGDYMPTEGRSNDDETTKLLEKGYMQYG